MCSIPEGKKNQPKTLKEAQRRGVGDKGGNACNFYSVISALNDVLNDLTALIQ